jgi:hypothetical protein
MDAARIQEARRSLFDKQVRLNSLLGDFFAGMSSGWHALRTVEYPDARKERAISDSLFSF